MVRPLILFAPGAGAPSTSDWMRGWRTRLATLGEVATFDYPYMRAGRRSPDRHEVLVRAHREALAATLRVAADLGAPVVLVGKSMGGRIGCHAALEEPAVRALVCLGYPLRTPAGAVRDAVLLALRTPVLFVQGTRDALCPLDLLAAVRARMTAPSELFVVEGGDHSLVPSAAQRKKSGIDRDGADRAALGAIGAFLERTLG